MRFHKLKTDKGFTLLEVMIAVAIFGVISSIIFPALIQFLDMRDRVDQKHRQVSQLQKTFLFFANDLRFAANRLSKDEYGEIGKTTLVLNDDSLLDFTGIYPDFNLEGQSVPRRVQWKLEDGTLKRLQYPVMDPEADTRVMVQSLLADVQDIEIEVSHIVDGRDETDDKWDEQAKLPDFIDIKIELESGVEYRRAFSMQGGDAKAAIAAVIGGGSGPVGSGGSGPGTGSSPPTRPTE